MKPPESTQVVIVFIFYTFQCRALAKRLAIAEKNRETLSEEVKLANQNITRLQVKDLPVYVYMAALLHT